MKRKLLEDVGLEKDAIDRIIVENGNDVNAAKADYETLKQQLDSANTQIQERDNQLELLKHTSGDVEGMKQHFNPEAFGKYVDRIPKTKQADYIQMETEEGIPQLREAFSASQSFELLRNEATYSYTAYELGTITWTYTKSGEERTSVRFVETAVQVPGRDAEPLLFTPRQNRRAVNVTRFAMYPHAVRHRNGKKTPWSVPCILPLLSSVRPGRQAAAGSCDTHAAPRAYPVPCRVCGSGSVQAASYKIS